MARQVEWDPTGRYVITSVCQGINSRDTKEKVRLRARARARYRR
jgi:hypothetical protein